MSRYRRLLFSLALLGASAAVAVAQDTGPLAVLRSRGANPNGPFAGRAAATDSVVARAREQLGVRYRFASATPDRGFDCSGLAKYVLGAFGVDLPHSSARIAREGVAVMPDTSALLPGDLLIFGRGRNGRISHVAIYVGDGKMIHASTSQRRVIETAIPSSAAALKLRAVRRVL